MRKNESPFWPQKSILNPAPPKEPYEPVRRVRMTLTRDEQKLVDRAAAKDYQVAIPILMEHAGLAVANACVSMAKASTTPIHVFAGKGKNGGDSYVAARILKSWGYKVTIWDCFPGDTHSPIVQNNREAAEKFGVPIRPASEFDPSIWQAGISRMIHEEEPGMPCVLVDGIIGTGFEASRPLPPNLLEITSKIEEGHVRGARVIAIDIPTGVDCDTGEVDPGAISADLTLSFLLPKKGITVMPGKAKAGTVRVPTIGLPINFADLVLGPVPEEPQAEEPAE
ncbi:MAG: NAD(P)H-hydrate epimerase [Clostridiales bacterium]|nr:NAD(P)H-hydrate epimerase [Clostridiales bacterium]